MSAVPLTEAEIALILVAFAAASGSEFFDADERIAVAALCRKLRQFGD